MKKLYIFSAIYNNLMDVEEINYIYNILVDTENCEIRLISSKINKSYICEASQKVVKFNEIWLYKNLTLLANSSDKDLYYQDLINFIFYYILSEYFDQNMNFCEISCSFE